MSLGPDPFGVAWMTSHAADIVRNGRPNPLITPYKPAYRNGEWAWGPAPTDEQLLDHKIAQFWRDSEWARQAPVLTDEQLDRLKAEWERKRHGHPKVLGLPRRVRLRLAVTGIIDGLAIWFAEHGMLTAAELIWWRGCRR